MILGQHSCFINLMWDELCTEKIVFQFLIPLKLVILVGFIGQFFHKYYCVILYVHLVLHIKRICFLKIELKDDLELKPAS